ncbi:unnamed protein product [Pleuronectes platessa]|uniref:Uncharacterized protein n=1 Tax=Pleuronectes platessa TaxID=8262 RepID=A0A9N7V8F0_PLEPL|nr:unnamed protein product [Pleuronectes platessa]
MLSPANQPLPIEGMEIQLPNSWISNVGNVTRYHRAAAGDATQIWRKFPGRERRGAAGSSVNGTPGVCGPTLPPTDTRTGWYRYRTRYQQLTVELRALTPMSAQSVGFSSEDESLFGWFRAPEPGQRAR